MSRRAIGRRSGLDIGKAEIRVSMNEVSSHALRSSFVAADAGRARKNAHKELQLGGRKLISSGALQGASAGQFDSSSAPDESTDCCTFGAKRFVAIQGNTPLLEKGIAASLGGRHKPFALLTTAQKVVGRGHWSAN